MSNKKIQTARLSIFSNITLIVLKLIAGLASGAVSIISEAIHSAMDLVAAIIAFYSVKISSKPPDSDHPYGHGKFENVSGVVEALLIFVAAIWIISESVKKIIHKEPIEALEIGIIVMIISGIVNFFVSKRLYTVAKETDSVALEADALHLKTDVYTSLGVGFGLFIIWITDISLFDPVVAILVAIFILKESYVLLKKSYSPLLDHALPEDDIETIREVIYQYAIPFHDMRTRKAGDKKFVDFHLEMPEDKTLKEVHRACDEIEEAIKDKIENIEVTIHVETQE